MIGRASPRFTALRGPRIGTRARVCRGAGQLGAAYPESVVVTVPRSPARELITEVRKLGRRPAVRVLTALTVLSVPGLYALLGLSIPAAAGQAGLARQVARLEPAEFPWMVVTNLQQMYFAFAVILGGLAIGQELIGGGGRHCSRSGRRERKSSV